MAIVLLIGRQRDLAYRAGSAVQLRGGHSQFAGLGPNGSGSTGAVVIFALPETCHYSPDPVDRRKFAFEIKRANF